MQLTAEQKVALTLWIHKNKELCEKCSSIEIAEKFSLESGIKVSSSSVLTTRNAVFPTMKRVRKPSNQQSFNMNLVIEKMNRLNDRLLRIESELGMLPLNH